MPSDFARPPAPAGFDPLSPEALRDPATLYGRARQDQPVFWFEALGVWMVLDRDAVDRGLTDFRTFSVAANAPPVPPAFQERVPQELLSYFFITMDPPVHTEARKVGQRGFTRGRMDMLESEIAARAQRIIDGFAARGACELMGDYNLELTTQTLMALLDVGDDMKGQLMQLRDDHFRVLASGREAIPEPERSELWERYAGGHERLRQLVDERTAEPGEDVVSAMATATDRDGRTILSRERVAQHLIEFAAAGTDTTAQLMGHAVVFLTENPDQLQAAQNEPDLWRNIVEETLRRRQSAPYSSRVTTAEVEICGVAIPKGEMIWFALGAAANDPGHYDHPERFDLRRPAPEDHFGFGKGRHFCLGAPLARVQTRVGLRVLYDRLPDLRVDEDYEPDFLPLMMLPLRRSLPVSWRRARRRSRTTAP